MITRLINICWSIFKLGLGLAVLAAVGVTISLFMRVDDEIRQHVQQELAEYFPQLNVSIGGARLIEGQGIAIYDLTISETNSARLHNNLLVVDEVLLVCDAQLTQLIRGVPTIRRMVIRHPQLWVIRSAERQWNLAALWPLPKCKIKRPQIVIEDADIIFADEGNASLPSLALRDVNLTIDTRLSQIGLSKTQEHIAEASAASPEIESGTGVIEIHGTLSGSSLKRAELHAEFDQLKKTWHVMSKLHQVELGKELLAWTTAYGGLDTGQTALLGKVDGEVVVEHQLANQETPRFEAKLRLSDGRLEDPQLPYPVTDLNCMLHCQNSGLKINQLRGAWGSANIALQLERHGWSKSAPLAMAFRGMNIPLDKKLYSALPNILKSEWDKYLPTGNVNADLQITFDGFRWRPRVTLTGSELAFESEKFQYRVHNGSGTMHYTPAEQSQPAVLDIDLIGYGGGQPLKFVGQVFNPEPGAVGWMEITGQGLEIEKAMIAALKSKTRQVIESLHPEGQFNVRWRIDRKQLGQTKLRSSLRLELVDCRIKYEKFPYPLGGIHGLVQSEDDQWSFRDLVSGGSRSVQCYGFLRPSQAGRELWLKFTGQQIPLDSELRGAVPDQVREAWEALHPRGSIDLVSAEIYNDTGFTKPSIRVAVRPRPESATIQPKFFPFLLEQLAGEVNYYNGELLISELTGLHNRTQVRTNGSGYFGSDGAWNVQLEGLSGDRLAFRRDLLVALPLKLRKIIDQLRLTGGFGLHNTTMRFAKTAEANAKLAAQWDMQIECHQTDMQPGIELHNVHGTVRLIGASQEGKSYSAGELAIDTATFEDVQFTNIRGPLWIDETSCLIGEWACRRQGLTPRRLTASVYDGTLMGDAWVTYDGLPRYSATAVLADASLLRIMTERFHGQQDYLGNVAANVTLNGYGRSLHTLEGDGNVRITEANIHELPLLVGLLKVLRNTTPDTTAFNQCDTRFSIQGRHIHLDQFDFLGDAVSLLGHGEADFDHNIKLSFHGVVGRNQIRLPLVKNLIQQAGKQTMQLSVDGTLSDPIVHVQALPGINKLLQQIREDLPMNGPSNQMNEARRRDPWLPGLGR